MHIRRIAAAFLAAVFVTGLSLGFPQIARAAVVPSPSWNELVWPDMTARSNVMCLDDPGGSAQAGQFLELWHCQGSTNQRWQFIPVATDPNGHTAYVIRNTGNQLCVGTALFFGGNPPPSNVVQRACPADVWVILDGDPVDTANFELEHATMNNGVVTDSGLCLQAVNTSDVNGTGIAWGASCAQFNDQRQMLTLG
jgi:Ricin-type beta-trefoil lectin domain